MRLYTLYVQVDLATVAAIVVSSSFAVSIWLFPSIAHSF